jgi:geranylgeranyl diphosphate synthase, type II
MSQTFSEYLTSRQAAVDAALEAALPAANTDPATLHQAMRHSMFAGGKRLRPILLLAAAEAVGGAETQETAMPAALSVECIHTYSLIHDDLPCMDDDDFRRGHPTCHKVYGEAIALLAGDAMQPLAFELLLRATPGSGFTHTEMVRELAQAAGSRWLVGGQVRDLEGEGKRLSLEQLKSIHEGKTMAMLSTSLRLGGMCAGASSEQMAALTKFGQCTGLAFQIIDDILDVTQTSEKLGKTAGKDVVVEKSTYPALLGLEESRQQAATLTQEARDSLVVFGERGLHLAQLADYLLGRDY